MANNSLRRTSGTRRWQKELANAKQKIADGRSQIASARQQVADGQAQIATAQKKLDEGWNQYNDGKKNTMPARKT